MRKRKTSNTMSKEVYLNNKQMQFLRAPQKSKVLVGGRGVGKSRVLAYVGAEKATLMPRSKGFLASTTYSQLLTKTWPAIAEAWEAMGYIEGIHYVMGIRPPKHFKTAISPPKRFGNVVTFMNGRTVDLISMDRPELARGGSYDDGDIDEAALVKQEHWSVILLPSIRGNKFRFGHVKTWQMVGFYTSLPWKATGYWILDYEEKAKAEPSKYFYLEASALDNIEILGQEGIDRMRAEMSYLQFQTEVMNVRVLKVEDSFYNQFNRERHMYMPGHLYSQDASTGRDVIAGRTDVIRKQFLEISLDFGGWISCMCVFQEQPNREERMVDSFYVKGDSKIAELVKRFTEAYADHQYKYVRMWGEPRGHDRNATSGTIYQQLVTLFAAQGWQADVHAPAKTSGQHIERQHFIGTILAEETRGYPTLRMSEERCRNVRIALQGAQSLPSGQKDKRNEKIREFPQEHATHFTDVVDYYFEQKWGRRVTSGNDSSRAGEAMFG